MHKPSTLMVARALVLALLAACSPASFAQQPWPSRPITIVVPVSLGTGPDIVARLFGQKFAERAGATIIVDNRPAAGGMVGIGQAARMPADGHTWLMAPTSFVQQAVLDRSVPYDPFKSFTPVCLIALGTLVLAVSDPTPARSAAEFIALAKSKPGELTYGTPGNGTPHHLSFELLKLDAGINVVHVPYKDSGSATRDLTAAVVNSMILPVSTVVPMAKSGRVRVLATLGESRTALFPEAPTLREMGYPSLNIGTWIALMVPAGTPPDIVAKLNAEMNALLDLPDIKGLITRQGMIPQGGPPERLGELVKSDYATWSRAVTAARIKAD